MPLRPLRRALCAAAALAFGAPAAALDVRDLYFGEALYHAHQEDWFEALQRLDAEIAQHYAVDEPQLDSLQIHIGHAEFSVGDFELSYRMHHRAGRAIRAVLEADVADEVRNEAAYRLAKIHFQKDQPEAALRALLGIDGPVPEPIRDDVEFLRANVFLALGRPDDAAEVLEDLQRSKELAGFSAYNLGIARLQQGRHEDAVRQLDRAGRIDARDPATYAIRDKANLVLGTLLFEASEFGLAQRSLDRVRLQGAFSNQALLRAGWSDASAGNFERALVPWSVLAERNRTDAAVQEALLALPYAYGRLDVHGRAALLYGQAVEIFGEELAKLDASVESIREGRFLEALVREEIRQSKDWVIHLRSLPDAPETFYLMTLMASHEFQTALQNYLDLEDLRVKLTTWQRSFDSFDDLIRRRRAYYEPRLPEIDRHFRTLDAKMRLRSEQQRSVDHRLQHMLIAPRPDLLATADELEAGARLERVEAELARAEGPAADALRRRVARLQAHLTWNLETRYHERLDEVHEHLRELNADMARLRARYEAYVRTRQAATHSYVGYELPIARLRERVSDALERVGRLMARQGHLLEVVAVDELQERRTRLQTYQHRARFAFADSYDRAAKAQAR